MFKFFKENRFEIILLGFSFCWVVASILLSKKWPRGLWFARSGAIMVLLSAIVEFNLGNLQQASNSRASIVAGLGIPVSSDLSVEKKYLAKIALIFVILGTFIWGYGDLIF